MSEWITDRLPTEADSTWNEVVWVSTLNEGVLIGLSRDVKPGEPWMPMQVPKPYVAITNTGGENE
jgi:hypothetical protein